MRKFAIVLFFILGVSSVSAYANMLAPMPEAVDVSGAIVSENTVHPDVENVAEMEMVVEDVVQEPDRYSVSGTTITVNATPGEDITDALDEALEEAKGLAESGTIYTVTVPAGEYYISGILHIYSNTTLSLYGVTLKCKPGVAEHNMLITGTTSYNNSSACSGYTGFQNISLLGGTYEGVAGNAKTPIRLFHATNVTVKDITITGGECNHQLEVVAIKNFRVEDCTFKNMSATEKASVSKREALQFDIASHESIYPDIVMDGTMMQDVVVTGCTFDNVSRGMGSHSLLLNAYHDNIKITNNTFKNIEQEAITALNYTNVEISGNVMNNVGTGILYQFSKGDKKTIFTTIHNGTKKFKGTQKTEANAQILNNTIVTKYNEYCDENQGIKLYGRLIEKSEVNSVDGGTIPAGNYYISGVLVDGNTITASGYGVSLTNAHNCVVTNNVITGKGYSSKDPVTKKGIYNGINIGKASQGNIIKGNKISTPQCNGIYLQGESTVASIENNVITDAGKEGIFLYEKSQVTGSVKGNVISGSASDGISVDDSSKVSGSIADNTISDCGEHGIYILNKATVSKDIKGNTIQNSGGNGILININAKVSGNINKNKIKNSKNKHGIYLMNKATVSKSIKDNVITGAKENAICVNTSAVVKKDISGNKITSAKRYGIYVLNKAKVKGNIYKNKITKTNTPIVLGDNVTGNIRENTIKSNTNNKYNILKSKIKTGNLKKPSIKKLSKKGKTLTVTWKKMKGVDGYFVEISTKSDFSKNVKSMTSKSTKVTFKKLSKGKTYYVRISTFRKVKNTALYSPYSKVKKIKL